MVDEYSINLLQSGQIETWNIERAEDPDASYNLSGAELFNTKLIRANLREIDLTGADLSGADLYEADLSGADLYEADLSKVNLMRANLTSVSLNGADLTGARIGWTIFADVDLRSVKGLETVEHLGPSTIGTDTLESSQGDIPEAFLRGAGLSNAAIAYARSLKNNPIEYYTCFISYSSQDDTFAKRLHADLQQQGVPCWFAPHSLRPGDLILARIEEAIRLYDKLVLILSQHSVESRWVEVEVTTARTKEVHQDCQMLFPLRLDETVMSTTTAWAISLREQRHIADFTEWKDHDTYQQAFMRLLRNLQASTEQKP